MTRKSDITSTDKFDDEIKSIAETLDRITERLEKLEQELLDLKKEEHEAMNKLRILKQ